MKKLILMTSLFILFLGSSFGRDIEKENAVDKLLAQQESIRLHIANFMDVAQGLKSAPLTYFDRNFLNSTVEVLNQVEIGLGKVLEQLLNENPKEFSSNSYAERVLNNSFARTEQYSRDSLKKAPGKTQRIELNEKENPVAYSWLEYVTDTTNERWSLLEVDGLHVANISPHSTFLDYLPEIRAQLMKYNSLVARDLRRFTYDIANLFEIYLTKPVDYSPKDNPLLTREVVGVYLECRGQCLLVDYQTLEMAKGKIKAPHNIYDHQDKIMSDSVKNKIIKAQGGRPSEGARNLPKKRTFHVVINPEIGRQLQEQKEKIRQIIEEIKTKSSPKTAPKRR